MQGLTSLAEIMGAGKLLGIIVNLAKNVPLLSESLGNVGAGTTLGLGAAALAAGYGLGTLADKLFGITPALTPFTEKLQQFVSGIGPDFIRQQQNIALALHGLATEAIPGTVSESEKLEAAAAANRASFAEWAKLADELGAKLHFTKDGLVEIIPAVKEHTEKIKEAKDEIGAYFEKFGQPATEFHIFTGDLDLMNARLNAGIVAIGLGSKEFKTFGDSTELAAKGFRVIDVAVHDSKGNITGYTQALSFVGPAATDAGEKTALAMSKTFEETLKAQQQVNEFELAWRKIQSDENVEIFRIQAEVDIAAIQAGTEQIKAAFESVNTTIESTGDLMSDLVKALTDVSTGSGAGQEIIHLLEEENRRRQEALDLQKELTLAQVDYLHAVIDRLTSGEVEIKVSADGLEPDLEMILFKILKRIQVKASAEASQFLLGL
ncbi:MAG TPA: hypothetical protein VGX03_11875 [Candidatus Binatia bacterium]|nr:hypothetical protein [Candidatus Binatia bacterium]